MSCITSSKSSINHLWEMDHANYTLLLCFMCVCICGVCTCVCNPEVNRWCLPQLLSTFCVLAEGLPLTPELVNSAGLTGSRGPPSSNAPSLRISRHMLSHPASVGAGIQTQVLGLVQPPLYQMSQLHSLDLILFLRQRLIDLSLLDSNPQIAAIFSASASLVMGL